MNSYCTCGRYPQHVVTLKPNFSTGASECPAPFPAYSEINYTVYINPHMQWSYCYSVTVVMGTERSKFKVNYPQFAALRLIFPAASCCVDANLQAVLQGALNAYTLDSETKVIHKAEDYTSMHCILWHWQSIELRDRELLLAQTFHVQMLHHKHTSSCVEPYHLHRLGHSNRFRL